MTSDQISITPEAQKMREALFSLPPKSQLESMISALMKEQSEKESLSSLKDANLKLSERVVVDLRAPDDKFLQKNQEVLETQKNYIARTGSIPRLTCEKSPNFTAKHRQKRLTQLFGNNERNHGAGCSSLLNLFVDEFMYLVNRLPNEISKRIRSSEGAWSQNYLLRQLNESFFLLIESLSMIQSRGCLWGYPISLACQTKAPFPLQQIHDEIEIIKGDLEDIKISLNLDVPTANKIKELVLLLEDVIFCELDTLYLPLFPLIDAKGHFQRLKFRSGQIANLKQMIGANLQLFKEDGHKNQFKIDIDHLDLEIKTKFNHFAFFHKKFSKKCEENSRLTTHRAKELLLFLTQEKSREALDPLSSYVDEIFNLSFEINDQPTRDLLKVAMRLCNSALLLKEMTTLEGVYSAIDSLLPLDHTMMIERTQNYFKEVTTAYDQVLALSSSEIMSQLRCLEGLALNEDERDHFNILKENWEKGFSPFIDRSQAELDLLRFHQHRLQALDVTRTDLILALRDAFTQTVFVSFNYYDHCFKVLKKHQSAIRTNLEGDYQELLGYFCDSLSDFIHIHKSLMEVSSKSLRFLINKAIELNLASQPFSNEKKGKAKKQKNKTQQVAVGLPPSQGISQASNEIASPSFNEKKQLLLEESSPVVELVTKNPPKRKKKKKKVKSKQALSYSPKNDLLSIKKSTALLLKEKVKGECDCAFRQKIFLDDLKNLEFKMGQFEETLGSREKGGLSLHHIFSQCALIHKLMEGAIQISLAYFPTIDEERCSVLHKIPDLGHHLLVYCQLAHTYQAWPKNVRQVVQNNQRMISFFSQANACVNYPHTTFLKRDLPSQTKELLTYLLNVRAEAESQSNPELQRKFMKEQAYYVEMALSFVAELLKAILEPSYSPLNKGSDDEFFYHVKGENEGLGLKKESLSFLSEELLKIVGMEEKENDPQVDLSLRSIKSADEAINVIKWAKSWLAVKTLNPVQGKDNFGTRKKQRDLILANVQLYLYRLAETIDPKNEASIFDVIFNGMELMRSAFKEMIVAALLSGDYSVEGRHIVEVENLFYKNNPCFLIRFLRHYSPNRELLPDLNRQEFKWLSVVHPILSYPHSPFNRKDGVWSERIIKLAKEVKFFSDRRKKTEDHFIFIGCKQHEENPLDIDREIRKQIKDNQKEYIFKALLALLQLIKNV